MNKEGWRQVERARCSGRGITRGCWRSVLAKTEMRSLELFRELATATGAASAALPAALSGSLNKAPGFAGGYLLSARRRSSMDIGSAAPADARYRHEAGMMGKG